MHAPWLHGLAFGGGWYTPEVGQGHVAERLNALTGVYGSEAVPRFELSSEALGALAYERQVGTGVVPTRDLAHDWYNGLVWIRFPRSKTWINQAHLRHAAPPLTQASSNGRTRLRDALTLFDESGALLLTRQPEHAQALVQHDWQTLFELHAPRRAGAWVGNTQLVLFGHGLLEALHRPHRSLCAKVLPVVVPQDMLLPGTFPIWLDDCLVKVLACLKHPAQLSPLPVMGVPGWFAEAQSPGFYEDATVFRGKPTPKPFQQPERLAFWWDGSTLQTGKCAGQSPLVFQGEESPDSSEQGAG